MLKYALNFFVKLKQKLNFSINKLKQKVIKLYLNIYNTKQEVKKSNFNIIKIKQEFLELIFPAVCGKCGKLDANWICEKCYKDLKRLKVITFKKNKKKIFDIKKKYIKEEKLLEKEIYYDELIYIFNYKGSIRKLIIDYKFNNKAYISNLFASIILKDEKYCNLINNYDVIIPVPMFEKKKKQRGYNQTELIAKTISEKLNIQLEMNCLIKTKNTKMQSTLSALDRKENIKNAFLVNNIDKIKDKKIIIFDDIFTTGETVKEISRVLKKAGAKEILVFVIAKD